VSRARSGRRPRCKKGESRCKEAVRKKVQFLYPENEWDEFTDKFFERIQEGIEQETARKPS
jgi:hypothetical protein